MESNYSNKEFEHYIKQNADQYRMFPSDKVWKGINNALHTRRKWYGFWLGFLLLVTGGAVTWIMTTQPISSKENITSLNTSFSPVSADNFTSPDKSSSGAVKHLLPFTKLPVSGDYTVSQKAEKSNIILPAEIASNTRRETAELLSIPQNEVIQTGNIPPSIASTSSGINPFPESKFIDIAKKTPEDIITSDHTGEFYFPYTIESITNSYRYTKPAKKMSWQLFITPTVSYRRLTVNKTSDNIPAFNYPFALLSDVNSAVTHKPDLGLQIGLSGRYPITRSLKLRAGMQFNINRYDIKAYAFNGEVATIDLNGGSGNSSISTWTNYRNYAGYKSDWLKNYYFSVSAPLGAEMKLIGNNKTNLGVAGTIQPTYILKDRAYLISTDYKNYAEVPRLVRHVNLNTSFETFINYTNGKTKWQIGPQVRYQLLSSFHSKYPIKENLFDFGVKVGVTLNE